MSERIVRMTVVKNDRGVVTELTMSKEEIQALIDRCEIESIKEKLEALIE